MLKTFANLFNKKERLKKKVRFSESAVADILNMIGTGEDKFRSKDTKKPSHWVGFDYVVTDSQWFFNEKRFLGFFFEEDTVYSGFIQRTSNLATYDEDTVLYYDLSGPVYGFKKGHALYDVFENIKNNLENIATWGEENIGQLERLSNDIDEYEQTIHSLKSEIENTNSKIESIQQQQQTLQHNDYFERILTETKNEKASLMAQMESAKKKLEETKYKKESLKRDYEQLKKHL